MDDKSLAAAPAAEEDGLANALAVIGGTASFSLAAGFATSLTPQGAALEAVVAHPDGALALLQRLLLPAVAVLSEPAPAGEEATPTAPSRRRIAAASVCYALEGMRRLTDTAPQHAAAAVVAVLGMPDAAFTEFLLVMKGCLLSRIPLGAAAGTGALLDDLSGGDVFVAAGRAAGINVNFAALRGLSMLKVSEVTNCSSPSEWLQCLREEAAELGDAAAVAAAESLRMDVVTALMATCDGLRARAAAVSDARICAPLSH